MPSAETRLFVYGTLRRDARHPMGRYLAEHAEHEGEAVLEEADLFDLGSYPGVRVPGGGTVLGDVYALHPDTVDAVMARLDDYEGCGADDPPPHQYARQLLTVNLADEEDVEAWVYVLRRVPLQAVPIPSGDYLVHLHRRRG